MISPVHTGATVIGQGKRLFQLFIIAHVGLDAIEDALPDALLTPAPKAAVKRLPVAVEFQDVASGRPTTHAPQDAVKDGAVVVGGTSRCRW